MFCLHATLRYLSNKQQLVGLTFVDGLNALAYIGDDCRKFHVLAEDAEKETSEGTEDWVKVNNENSTYCRVCLPRDWRNNVSQGI